MATKPTETVAFEPTSVVAIPSPKQAVGFTTGEKPPARYFNWLFRTFSRLYNYVIDGQWTGNHTITGTLGVSGLVTASGGVTAAANQHVTVSGTGDIKHGDRTLQWAAAGALIAQTGTITTNLTADVVTGSSAIILGSVPLRKGDRIKSMSATFDGISSQNVTYFKVERVTATGTATSLGSTSTSGLTGPVTLTITLTNTTLGENEYFVVSASINAAGVLVRSLATTYDHP